MYLRKENRYAMATSKKKSVSPRATGKIGNYDLLNLHKGRFVGGSSEGVLRRWGDFVDRSSIYRFQSDHLKKLSL